MQKLFLAVFVAALALTAAGAASAKQFPNATCPDTLSIVRLKSLYNTADPCAPASTGTGGAPGDTVNGVGGIIIGFDEVPTGFDIFLQQSAGGPNSGIDCFTHGTNFRAPYGFNLGDSMVVEYARVSNFQGDIEVEAPNNNFSNPNIVLRKFDSGHALPPLFTGNSTDLRELPTNTTFAPYVSALVQLTGPVRVARRIRGTVSPFPFVSALVVSDAATSDSVFIDYLKLMNGTPPVEGTIFTSVTGIGNKATRGFRIMPRNAHDIIDTQPPSVTDSYSIADNEYRVVFDRDVTPASATNTANYSLASFGTVNGAVMDGTHAVILDVTNGLAHGASETVNVNGVTGVDNGVSITSPVNYSFLAGTLSTGEMSAPNPDSLAATPCRDVSRYVGFATKTGQYTNGDFGPRSSFTGIVVGIYGNLYYMEDATPLSPANNHRGITVFAPPQALTLGHQYVLAGNDEEFFSENEFAGISFVKDVGSPGVPAAISLTVGVASYDTCDANQNLDSGRDYLSELVTLANVKVVQRFPTLPTTGFHVVGPTTTYADTIFIENQNTVLGANSASNPNYPALGMLCNITGVVHYTTNTSTPSFRVCPRNAADIQVLGPTGVTPTTRELSFAAYPNPGRAVNLAFTLPHAMNVDIGVFDLLGRKVASIASGRMPAGQYTRSWSGLDDSGATAHSGVYFYRMRADGKVLTARTMLVSN